jgi:dephospho-CoA kinase
MKIPNQFVIGLTGSIGMGKSTTADMFRTLGVAVWDADHSVHHLYSSSTQAIEAISNLCPAATVSGIVDRDVLTSWIKSTPDGLKQIEAVIHPLLAKNRQEFLESNPGKIVVLDVPLLFETGLYKNVDCVVVVSAPADVQRKRVLGRPNMTSERFEQILSKQLPDTDKRERADFVIETTSLETAQADVKKLLNLIRSKVTEEMPNA